MMENSRGNVHSGESSRRIAGGTGTITPGEKKPERKGGYSPAGRLGLRSPDTLLGLCAELDVNTLSACHLRQRFEENHENRGPLWE